VAAAVPLKVRQEIAKGRSGQGTDYVTPLPLRPYACVTKIQAVT